MNIRVALLALGSAILLLSCKGKETMPESDAYEKLMTHKTDSMQTVESVNGKVKYRFEAPLMERYQYARQPYMEFRQGIYIETYNDSTMTVESTLRADYALYLESQDLWEAKGNVVGTNARGEVLETQQLFWNRKIKLIYSNIDSKITRPAGITYSQGFESDEEFKNWRVHRVMGWTEFEERERRRKESEAANEAPSVSSDPDISGQTVPESLNMNGGESSGAASGMENVGEGSDTEGSFAEPEGIQPGVIPVVTGENDATESLTEASEKPMPDIIDEETSAITETAGKPVK